VLGLNFFLSLKITKNAAWWMDGWMDNIIIWINFFIGLCVCVIGYELIFFCFKNTTVTSNMNRKQNNNQSPFFFLYHHEATTTSTKKYYMYNNQSNASAPSCSILLIFFSYE
jgi:hypothetical protein